MLQTWVGGRLWVLGTGAGAAVVFVLTFLLVSSVDGGTISSAPAGAGRDRAPAASAFATEPASGTAAAQNPTPPPPTAAPPATPARPSRPLPAFDEDALIHGGDGDEGAILGGPGIVPSSGLEARTDWELLIPAALIKASIVTVGLTPGGALGAPDNPEVIGWWEDGPRPGERGNVLLDGHRDFMDINDNVGTGVAWLLPTVQVGDVLLIRDNALRVYHLYTAIETVSVGWDAQDGVEYLRPSDTPILTLITCEGAFDADAHNYSNRRIVVAEWTDTIPFPAEAE